MCAPARAPGFRGAGPLRAPSSCSGRMRAARPLPDTSGATPPDGERGTVSLRPRARTVRSENFRDHCTNGKLRPGGGRSKHREGLGDILLPPRSFPLPLSVPSALPAGAGVGTVSPPSPSCLGGASLLTAARGGFIPAPRTAVTASPPPLRRQDDTRGAQVRPHPFRPKSHLSPTCKAVSSVVPPPSPPTVTRLSPRTQELQKSHIPGPVRLSFHVH